MIKDAENFNFAQLLNEQNKENLKTALEGLNYEQVNENGQDILHLACKEGNKEIIIEIFAIFENKHMNLETLLEKEDKKKWTPIYYAIDASENGFPDIVDLLLKKRANPNKRDGKGITPLHLAAYKGQDDNVEILIKHKADTNIKDIAGRIPLNYAIMEGQTNSVQALLENNSDLSSVDNKGDSLLHYAINCKGNALLYIIMLAERGINLNMQNNQGDTALNICAKNGAKENIRLIQKLLEFKCDPNIPNNKSETFYTILSVESEKEKFEYDQSDEEEEVEEIKEKEDEEEVETPQIRDESWLKKNSQLVIYMILPVVILIISKIAQEIKY